IVVMQQQFQHFQHQQHHHHHIHQVQSDSQLEHRNSDLDSDRNRRGDTNQNPNQNRNRNTDRVGSAMDFRNLCQRLDVDSLRAKLPSLPQLKLPKSLPKLRGRKIFRSSKAGAGGGGAPGAASKDAAHPPHHQQESQHLQVAPQSQQFINRTPQRISTISSLMYEASEQEDIRSGNLNREPGTYRSAGSLDDDYYAPGSIQRVSRPISPIRIPAAGAEEPGNSQPTFTQRLQRGYKSLSELRLKHIFAKQTTVRRDNIEVDRYVEQYERELKSEKLEQARRDREIAENYDIKIRTLSGTRQNTFEEDEVEHEQFAERRSSKAHLETDESGMEATPPALPVRRKPGIASTRFARVRKPPLDMEVQPPVEGEEVKTTPPRPSSYKQLLNRLPNLPSLPNLPQLSKPKEEKVKSEDNAAENNPNPKMGLKQNIKRLRKSIKRPAKIKAKVRSASEDSDEEEEQAGKEQAGKEQAPPRSTSANLRARLSRFASTEQLQQRWRSFKVSSKDGEPKAAAPPLEENQRDAGPGGNTEAGARVLGGFLLGAQLEKTLGKLNEKMHQLKFFQRHSNQSQTQNQPKPNTVGHEPVELDDDNELEATYHHSDSDEEEDDGDDSGEDVSAEEAFGQIQREGEEEEEEDQEEEPDEDDSLPSTATAHAARQMAKLAEIQAASKGGVAAWSSESLEEIADEDYPRVLIHQEHSDSFESTLIIAVASKGSVSPSARGTYPAVRGSPNPGVRSSVSPQAKTSHSPNPSAKRSSSPEYKSPVAGASISTNWLPNDQIIAGFQEQNSREASSWPAPALYKPKSIDIFEASSGGPSAFADFDEALRNAPVLRISVSTSSGEDADDSRASSRVTRIRVQSPQIGNSRESLMAQEEEDEDEDLEVDVDLELAEDADLEELERDSSERPPSASPPPPPLPQRRPPPPPKVQETPPIYDAVPPPLPVTKPPIPSQVTKPAPEPPISRGIPQRTTSMSRPAKPLVKTSSLRLTYNEQVRPGDIGKVNKLISRFEGGRPRLCPRRMHSEEYGRGRDEEEEEEELAKEVQVLIEERQEVLQKTRVAESVTPTNRGVIIPQITLNNNNEKTEKQIPDHQPDQDESRKKKKESLDLTLDRQNSNCSRSEYGSPLSFPSSRRSSTPTNLNNNNASPNQNPNPNPNPTSNPLQILQHQRRSRRSMTRDDDNFYSFDSDEENSYYSISPSGSSRYVVEI
ncbi:hypothetical protein KR009_005319, partial [Drosophila setifemur]